MSNTQISIVVPVYNETENVAKLVGEIAAALDGQPYEMVFVDDCSTDDTAVKLKSLQADYPALRAISHRTNAGQCDTRHHKENHDQRDDQPENLVAHPISAQLRHPNRAAMRIDAGAYGLMQVLPSTAKVYARKFNIPYSNRRDLLKPSINIEMGSRYLELRYNQMDQNPIYASAAYKAGKHRIDLWKPFGRHTTDIWIESIPYYETRNYVQRVLENVAVYRARLR